LAYISAAESIRISSTT